MRPRKPRIFKDTAGNPGKRKPKQTAGGSIAGELEAPSQLNQDAATIWNDTLPKLIADRTIASVDYDMLATYCEASATVRECTRLLNDSAQWMVVTHGGIHPSPLFKIRTDATRRMLQSATVLGIGQANRQRLTPIPESDKSDIEEEYFGRTG